MEHQKLTNSLDDTTNQPSEFRERNHKKYITQVIKLNLILQW